jgi:hypothetical protein
MKLDWIAWLDTHSGAASVVLTLVYTIATIALVKMNQKTIREMEFTRKQQILPQVTLEFSILRKGLCCLLLKNRGNSIAKHVAISFTSDCADNLRKINDQNDKFMKLLSAGNMVLAPGQREVYSLCGMVGDFDQLGAVPIKGTVAYTNIFEERLLEEFCIEVNSYEYALLYGSDAEEVIASINDGVKKIVGAINKHNNLKK